MLFEDVTSPASWTLPAHASLLTGRYPANHGVRTTREILPRDVPTLATTLALSGFATAGLVNSAYLGPLFELHRGFLRFEEVPPDHSAEGAARRVSELGLAWLSRLEPERRAFLFLHYFDVHSDYRSRPRIEARFAGRTGPEDGTTRQIMGLVASGGAEPGEVARLSGLYDAGIRQIDDEIGWLLARLDAEGRLDHTLVVVTSDHGEEFMEHGSLSHGAVLYQEQLHVPLILRGPGIPSGVRVDDPVSLVDVAPTLLARLEVPALASTDGRDLAPLWEGNPAAAERTLFAQASPAIASDARRAARRGRFKLLVDREAGTRTLFDLTADPGETRDATAEHPEAARALEEALDALEAGGREGAPAGPLDPETEEQLRALGYL